VPVFSQTITDKSAASRFVKGSTFAIRYEIIEKLVEGRMDEVCKDR
jgi:hypothetical protein